MKKLSILLTSIYVIIYLIYPIETLVKSKNQENVKMNEIPIEVVDGYLVLDDNKADSSDRKWGDLNNFNYMVYVNVDGYIYIDGIFHKVDAHWKNDKFYIKEKDGIDLFNLKKVNDKYFSATKDVVGSNVCRQVDKLDVLEKLSNPNLPIKNAYITKEPGQLPGANRDYRNGKHEGFDWYPGAIGTEISNKTKVYPIYEGTVVRIAKDYKELEPTYREKLLKEAAKIKYTPQSTLDLLRGRQVWVQSENGVLIHYAHLSSVNNKINVGDKVTIKDSIGTVGNSGTSNGALHTNDDLHLHTDLVVCGKNFWEYGEKSEMVNSLIKIFDLKSNKITNYLKNEA
ncbi:M23 family metallopeptidase [Bacillus toyonensis]|uniref:M23 family metallopeptidase n=1 Tax=Bacillus toyonensis TaxID=155322 RepID=UPI002E24A868|nr:M23 family metallopeptidase [Bacillus toyonensis]